MNRLIFLSTLSLLYNVSIFIHIKQKYACDIVSTLCVAIERLTCHVIFYVTCHITYHVTTHVVRHVKCALRCH
jgi:hypothetical protein